MKYQKKTENSTQIHDNLSTVIQKRTNEEKNNPDVFKSIANVGKKVRLRWFVSREPNDPIRIYLYNAESWRNNEEWLFKQKIKLENLLKNIKMIIMFH